MSQMLFWSRDCVLLLIRVAVNCLNWGIGLWDRGRVFGSAFHNRFPDDNAKFNHNFNLAVTPIVTLTLP